MQIHEVTQPSILGTIGKDIKSAVSAPFQKAAAVMSTPGAMTDPHAYRDAMQKYHAGQVAALEPQVQAKLAGQIAQRTQQRAQELSQKWTEYVKSKQPRSRLKSAPTPITPTGQYATKPPPGQTYGSNYPVPYKSPPTPPKQLGGPVSEEVQEARSSKSKSDWRKDALKSVGATFDTPPPARAKPGQMPASVASSKQGKLMLKAYGKPRGGIQDVDEAPQEYTTPGGIIVPGSTKTDTTASTPPAQTEPVAPPKTGISALPGSKPQTGGTVDPKISATPRTVLTGSRAQEFETWADQQLTSKIPGTNVVISIKQIKEKYPEVRQALNTALTNIIKGNNDPRAVQEYLTTAMQGMQRYSAELKQSGTMGRTGSTRNPMAQGVLDRYVDPVTVQKLQSLVQNNPTYAAILKKELGIT